MKLCLFLLLCSFSVFAQKIYTFDYKITYDYKLNDSSKLSEVIYYTNSKDNSYILKIVEKDSLNFEFTFNDNNGIYFKSLFDKKQLENTEDFLLDCEVVKFFFNPYKYQTDNYSFQNMKYALMEGEYYPFYILKSIDPKREKRKKLPVFYYYIENNTEFHLPILNHSTAYEEWKLERNIPNGIAKEMFYLDYKKTKKTSHL